ncbi:MAG: phage major capsid protein [Kiritimatiellia bacterium]
MLRDGHGGDTCGRLMPAYTRGGKLGGDKIIWGSSERAQVIMRDVESGVRRNISVEGDWDDKDLVLDGEKDGIPMIRAARWTPLAAAICDVPADPTVGVARSHDADGKVNETKTTETATIKPPSITARKNEMTDQELKERDAMRAKDSVEIFALARDYNVPQEQVTAHITAGKSIAEFQSVVLRDFAGNKAKADAERAVETAKVARTAGNVAETIPYEKLSKFSFMRAIVGMAKNMNPASELPSVDDGLEREVSQESVRLIRMNPEGKNYTPRGMCIPWDLVRAQGNGAVRREFNIAGTGSNVVAQNLRPELFIDYLRSKLILAKLGITTLTGLVGDVLIPKQTATAAGGWVDETTAGTAGTLTVGQVKVSPKTLGAYTDISRQLLMQSTPSADMLVMNDLVESLARSIQVAGFHGLGASNQPLGLFPALAAGIVGQGAAITESTVGSDGNPTYAEIEAMLATMEEANVDGDFKWALRPTAFRKLKGVGRVGTTGAVPIAVEEKGIKYLADTAAETTSALTSKYAVAGRWDSMVLAMWGALDLTLDPYSLSTRGALRVVALQSVDFGYRYLPAFAWSSKFAAS